MLMRMRGQNVRRCGGQDAKNAPLPFDLIKLPHHGSDRNIDTDYFRNLTRTLRVPLMAEREPRTAT